MWSIECLRMIDGGISLLWVFCAELNSCTWCYRLSLLEGHRAYWINKPLSYCTNTAYIRQVIRGLGFNLLCHVIAALAALRDTVGATPK